MQFGTHLFHAPVLCCGFLLAEQCSDHRDKHFIRGVCWRASLRLNGTNRDTVCARQGSAAQPR